jgi:dihydroorotase
VRVSAEASPHHLCATDELVRTLDANVKMNPPLRTEDDRRSLVDGLLDGTIDCVATDHAPHPVEAKESEWAPAAMGMIGLETALSVAQAAMVDTGLLDWAGLADRMSVRPARIGRLAGQGHLPVPGAPANLTLYDPGVRRVVDPAASVSKSRNTPFAGLELPGRVHATFLRGRPTVLEGKVA